MEVSTLSAKHWVRH